MRQTITITLGFERIYTRLLNKWRTFKTVQRDNPRSDSINAPYERKVRVTRYSGLKLMFALYSENCGMCLIVNCVVVQLMRCSSYAARWEFWPARGCSDKQRGGSFGPRGC